MKLYLVVIEDQQDCYEEHTAQISDVAYKDLNEAMKAFQNAINDIEGNPDEWWVAREMDGPGLVKEIHTDRMVEYYDRYGYDRLYVYIHEMELV